MEKENVGTAFDFVMSIKSRLLEEQGGPPSTKSWHSNFYRYFENLMFLKAV